MKTCKILFTIIFFILFINLTGCAQTERKRNMITTANSLMNYLTSKDTLKIKMLYSDASRAENFSDNQLELFSQITSRYGIPKTAQAIFDTLSSGGYEMKINLFNKTDSALKMNSCYLGIVFFSPEYSVANKLYKYQIFCDHFKNLELKKAH